MHDPRRLSSNLSCQHAGWLYQIHSADQGLALRGAHVSIVTHPDGKKEVLWQGRALPHTRSTKPARQAAAVDGKTVNAKVEHALRQRNSQPQPIGHPWKKRMVTHPGSTQVNAQFTYP
ncbi:hypothetical protein D3C86_1898440 [compost metagenome]